MQEKRLRERRAAFVSTRRERHEDDVATMRSAGRRFFRAGQEVMVKPQRTGTQHHALSVRLFEWLKSREMVERAMSGVHMEVVRVCKGTVRVECSGSKFSLPIDVLQRVSGVSLSGTACQP
jgi:hypothetical protein